MEKHGIVVIHGTSLCFYTTSLEENLNHHFLVAQSCTRLLGASQSIHSSPSLPFEILESLEWYLRAPPPLYDDNHSYELEHLGDMHL
jgi:hypothetical protein